MIGAGVELKDELSPAYIRHVCCNHISEEEGGYEKSEPHCNVLLLLCSSIPRDTMMRLLYENFVEAQLVISPYLLDSYKFGNHAWEFRGSIDIYTKAPYYPLQGRYYISERKVLIYNQESLNRYNAQVAALISNNASLLPQVSLAPLVAKSQRRRKEIIESIKATVLEKLMYPEQPDSTHQNNTNTERPQRQVRPPTRYSGM
jgi:hypothetical protein